MSSCHSLEVVLGVPVTVKDDDRVRCCKVNTKTPRPCGEKEAEVLAALSIKMLNCVPPDLTLDAAIKSLEGKPPDLQILGDHVQHPDHLTEDQDSVPRLLQSDE